MNPEATEPKSIIVPISYSGQWLAWDREGTRIVASGRTIQEAALAAAAQGESQPIFAKAPKADTHFSGSLQ